MHKINVAKMNKSNHMFIDGWVISELVTRRCYFSFQHEDAEMSPTHTVAPLTLNLVGSLGKKSANNFPVCVHAHARVNHLVSQYNYYIVLWAQPAEKSGSVVCCSAAAQGQ